MSNVHRQTILEARLFDLEVLLQELHLLLQRHLLGSPIGRSVMRSRSLRRLIIRSAASGSRVHERRDGVQRVEEEVRMQLRLERPQPRLDELRLELRRSEARASAPRGSTRRAWLTPTSAQYVIMPQSRFVKNWRWLNAHHVHGLPAPSVYREDVRVEQRVRHNQDDGAGESEHRQASEVKHQRPPPGCAFETKSLREPHGHRREQRRGVPIGQVQEDELRAEHADARLQRHQTMRLKRREETEHRRHEKDPAPTDAPAGSHTSTIVRSENAGQASPGRMSGGLAQARPEPRGVGPITLALVTSMVSFVPFLDDGCQGADCTRPGSGTCADP